MTPPVAACERVGTLFVISGPSGVGKGTLVKRLLAEIPNIVVSVSATTRAPRPGEEEGVAYHFLTVHAFQEGIAEDLFFEYARYNENYYGTPRDRIEAHRQRGIDVILEIEVQGAQIVKRLEPTAVLIYVQPPTRAELDRRLRARHTEDERRIQERLQTALAEQEKVPLYDYLITNDVLDEAVRALCSIVIAERHRILPNRRLDANRIDPGVPR